MRKQDRTTVAGLVVAGVAFTAYPALRPWSSETGLDGATAFASDRWVLAHVLGMVGFAALAFAFRAATNAGSWPWAGRPLRDTESRMWLATVLLLPFYGAEAFGVQQVGRYAVEHDLAALEVVDAFRYAPVAVTTFSLGLLVLVLVGGRLAHGLRKAGTTARAGALLAGVGLATYLPQFFTPAPVRILHGIVLGAGLMTVAIATARSRGPVAPEEHALVA